MTWTLHALAGALVAVYYITIIAATWDICQADTDGLIKSLACVLITGFFRWHGEIILRDIVQIRKDIEALQKGRELFEMEMAYRDWGNR